MFWNKHINEAENLEKEIYKIQTKFKCCGTDNYESWTFWARLIPGSCCGLSDSKFCDPEQVQEMPGCSKKLKSLFNTTFTGSFASALVLLFIGSLIVLLTGIDLFKEMKNKKKIENSSDNREGNEEINQEINQENNQENIQENNQQSNSNSSSTFCNPIFSG